MVATIHCPICGAPFPPLERVATAPFCSARCRQIDLGRWLGEKYSVPVERRDEEEKNLEERPPQDDE